jgi:hypothetical protein
MNVNGALAEDKICRFKGEKCPIYTHDGASAKFSTNSYETDYSVAGAALLQAMVNSSFGNIAFVLIHPSPLKS